MCDLLLESVFVLAIAFEFILVIRPRSTNVWSVEVETGYDFSVRPRGHANLGLEMQTSR